MCSLLIAGAAFACLLSQTVAIAQVKRVVVLKVDGLPGWYLDQAISTIDPENGKPVARYISQIFAERGTRIANFYARGLTLSVPCWQILDTGQHSQIRGNAEYDRYTLRVHDYLNFFPFVADYSRGRRTDMSPVEILDDLEIPLLSDRFESNARFQGFQLFQRGLRFVTLKEALTNRFATRSPQQLIDEWQAGFSMSEGVYEQIERELVQKLADPKVEYLDFFTGDFDHQAHLTHDEFTQRTAFERTDQLAGRIWTAIRNSPLAANTVMVLVSDHGMNTSPKVYSQGFNLVRFFISPEGGSHHTVTNRHPMQQFKIKGLDPFVNKVITRSETSRLKAADPEKYPTVLLDLDGNERASVYLRNKHLHSIHLLLEQLPRDKTVAPRILEIIDQQRAAWKRSLDAIRAEASELGRRVEVTTPPTRTKNREFTQEERDQGLNLAARRTLSQVRYWQANRDEYDAYADSLERLLALDRKTLESGKFRIEDLVHPGAMGEMNTWDDLRSYPVEWKGTEFRTIDYPAALKALTVRNVVQDGVGNAPIDFVAVRDAAGDSVRLFGGEQSQATVQWAAGKIRYEPLGGAWKAGLPLRLWEDPELNVSGEREEWLSQWHTESEWLRAAHRTHYSNAVIGLAEQFGPLRGLRRNAARADLLVMGNNHWNFNVRNFNPGGNHGSFFRTSTHSVLMFWGGEKTGIARGAVIDEPYDSLSFAPTILELLGKEHREMPGQAISGLATRSSESAGRATAGPSRQAPTQTGLQ